MKYLFIFFFAASFASMIPANDPSKVIHVTKKADSALYETSRKGSTWYNVGQWSNWMLIGIDTVCHYRRGVMYSCCGSDGSCCAVAHFAYEYGESKNLADGYKASDTIPESYEMAEYRNDTMFYYKEYRIGGWMGHFVRIEIVNYEVKK